MNSQINTIIIDDDLQNLDLLKHFLEKFCPLINIIGQANNIEDSIKLINKVSPDLIFLDIQIQDKNAFDILDRIDFTEVEIIFITAYGDYALKAFKYNAIDYILKPISIEDIILATNKVMLKLEDKKKFNELIAKEKNHLTVDENVVQNESPYITISSLNNIVILKKQEILFCKSEGRYTIFFMNNNVEHVSSKNLGEYEAVLTKDSFLRIHHSYIVNINHILNINKKQGYYCEMVNGALIPISRRKKDDLKSKLNI